MAVGTENRTFMEENQDDISPSMLSSFFGAVRQFYMAVTKKMLAKFPFGDTTFQDLAFLNPEFRHKLQSSCVLNLSKRFPQVVSTEERDLIQEEFLEYQVTPLEELPQTTDGIDNFWALMAEKKDSFTDKKQFGVISKLAKACCVIPNSNADAERIFSMLKKIQTDMRSELSNETICSLLCAKQNQDLNCYEYEPSASVLKTAKQAVVTYQKSLE